MLHTIQYKHQHIVSAAIAVNFRYALISSIIFARYSN